MQYMRLVLGHELLPTTIVLGILRVGSFLGGSDVFMNNNKALEDNEKASAAN